MIFHNLVGRLLKSGKDRPTDDDYAAGWRSFLEIAEIVKLQRCIVYGLEHQKVAALLSLLRPDANIEQTNLPAVGSSRPLALSFILNGRRVSLLFIRHPSAFFRWSEWGIVLRDTGMMPVVTEASEVITL